MTEQIDWLWSLGRGLRIQLALAVMLAVPTLGEAQRTETLIDSRVDHGGFGGPVVKFSEVDDQFAVFVGGRGGWIIDHVFSIGGGGYGLANQDQFDYVDDLGNPVTLTMGYGGLELEYINRPHELVHVSIQALVGAGGVTWDEDGQFGPGSDGDGDAFFVAEPGANVIMNVTTFFRIGIGASYRFVSDVELPGLTDDDLSGVSGVLTLKFGAF